MQIKFLPDFQSLRKNLLLGLKDLLQNKKIQKFTRQDTHQKQKFQEKINLISDAELFASEQKFVSGMDVRENFIKFAKWLTLGVSVLFTLLLFYNFYLDLKLADNKADLDIIYAEALKYENERQMALQIDDKVSFYKNIVSKRQTMGEKVEVVLSNMEPDMELVSLSADVEEFSVAIKGSRVLSFSILFDKYLKSGNITNLTITSAEYLASDDYFLVDIKGAYK